MIYLDTSFLVPLVLREATSAGVATVMGKLGDQALVVSHWTSVEFASLIARQVRMGGMDRHGAARAVAQFEEMLDASFDVVAPTVDDFRLARAYLAAYETGLRAGDALHLAIAGNRGARTIYSLDKGLVRACAMLGLPISTGGIHA